MNATYLNPAEIVVNGSQATEHEGNFVTEASTLRLAPGEWPRTLKTTLGNGEPFGLVTKSESGAVYKQCFGCATLTVFND